MLATSAHLNSKVKGQDCMRKYFVAPAIEQLVPTFLKIGKLWVCVDAIAPDFGALQWHISRHQSANRRNQSLLLAKHGQS